MNYIKGELVTHPRKQDWGIGMIVEDSSSDEVRVRFPSVGDKTLRLPVDLCRTGVPEMVTAFKRGFPGGFDDKNYLLQERDYKDVARKSMEQELGKDVFKTLLAASQHDQICRRALSVVNKTNLIFPNEKMALKDGLASPGAQAVFSERLYSLLYDARVAIEGRFISFAGCLSEIKAAKWPIVSYYLFLAFPREHMFLKPDVTQKAAQTCGFDLKYKPTLNWDTYSRLLEFASFLDQDIRSKGLMPKDMIDVQSFIWCVDKLNLGVYELAPDKATAKGRAKK